MRSAESSARKSFVNILSDNLLHLFHFSKSAILDICGSMDGTNGKAGWTMTTLGGSDGPLAGRYSGGGGGCFTPARGSPQIPAPAPMQAACAAWRGLGAMTKAGLTVVVATVASRSGPIATAEY